MKNLLLIGASLAVVIGISLIVGSLFINKELVDPYACVVDVDCAYQNVGENDVCSYGCVNKEVEPPECNIHEDLLMESNTRYVCACVDLKCEERIDYGKSWGVYTKVSMPSFVALSSNEEKELTFWVRNVESETLNYHYQFLIKQGQSLIEPNNIQFITASSSSLEAGQFQNHTVIIHAPNVLNDTSYLYILKILDESREQYERKVFSVQVTPE